MSGTKLFVDTNIILYFLKGNQEIINLISDKELVISCITEIELLSFPKITSETEQKIKELLLNFNIVDLQQDIKQLTIEFRRKYTLKLPDAIILASAYLQKIPLLTADKDFRKIDELDILIYEF